jgi:polyhydroxyalkanoate synthesis regulator phasin
MGDTTESSGHEEAQGLRGYVREAWSQALVAVGDAGDEVQNILGRVGGFVGMAPDEGRRLAHELAQKLKDDRVQLEQAVETAVGRAVKPFRLPTPVEVEALEQRLARLEAAVERLARARGR